MMIMGMIGGRELVRRRPRSSGVHDYRFIDMYYMCESDRI